MTQTNHSILNHHPKAYWTRGKHALITGASSGIGRELAENLAATCRRLTLVARNRDGRLDREGKRLRKRSKAKIETASLDICDVAGMSELIRKIYEEDHHQVDLFINCAGGSHVCEKFEAMNYEDIERIFDTNARAPLFWLRELLPRMRRNKMERGELKRAHVVMISSRSGERALPKLSVYAAAKGSIERLVEALQKEYTAHQIVFTLANPGSINTAFTAEWDARARNAHNAESMVVGEAIQPILQVLDSHLAVNRVSYESVKQWLHEPGVLID